MRRQECPNCGSLLDIEHNAKLGRVFNCPDCETELVFINIEPLEIDYYYGEDIEETYRDEYDEYSGSYEEEDHGGSYGSNYYDYDNDADE